MVQRIVYFFLFFLFFAYSVNAQQTNPPFDIELQDLEPYTTTRASLVNGSQAVDSFTSIVWEIDGVEIIATNNRLFVDIPLKGVGESTDIVVSVETAQNLSFTIQRLVYPVAFDLLVEGDVFTPAFYEGRKIVSPQSPIRVSAVILFVDGSRTYTEKDFSFQWQFNDFPVPINSINQSSVILPSLDYVQSPGNLRVIASHKNAPIFLKKNLDIEVESTKVVLYENHPIEGVYSNNSIGGDVLLNNQTNFFLLPLFFNRRSILNSNIYFAWFENGVEIHSGRDSDSLFVRPVLENQSSVIITARAWVGQNPGESNLYLQRGSEDIRIFPKNK